MTTNPSFLAFVTSRLQAGLQAIIDGFAALANMEMTVELADVHFAGQDTLTVLSGPTLWSETHILNDSSQRVGMLVSEELALRIGAGMMMMPMPAAMDEDMLMAFDEAVNVAIGLWNSVTPDVRWRWDNSVGARRLRPAMLEDVLADCRRAGLGLVVARVGIGAEHFPLLVFGHVPWAVDMPAASRAETRPVAAPEPEPLAPIAPKHPPSLDAVMAFVDRTGALEAWLREQLTNPDFVCAEADEPMACHQGARAIVLLQPSEAQCAEIRAGRTIVMRRA